ncbi:MAG: hypothetical protein IJD65_07505 [Mailhella sp.]|nr:hypothetical protein [Mailhella sp.]
MARELADMREAAESLGLQGMPDENQRETMREKSVFIRKSVRLIDKILKECLSHQIKKVRLEKKY